MKARLSRLKNASWSSLFEYFICSLGFVDKEAAENFHSRRTTKKRTLNLFLPLAQSFREFVVVAAAANRTLFSCWMKKCFCGVWLKVWKARKWKKREIFCFGKWEIENFHFSPQKSGVPKPKVMLLFRLLSSPAFCHLIVNNFAAVSRYWSVELKSRNWHGAA